MISGDFSTNFKPIFLKFCKGHFLFKNVAAIMKLKARAGIFFCNCEKSNDGVINNSFNSTMNDSFIFLKNMPFITGYTYIQCLTNSPKS